MASEQHNLSSFDKWYCFFIPGCSNHSRTIFVFIAFCAIYYVSYAIY